MTTQYVYDLLNVAQEQFSTAGVGDMLAGLGIDQYFSRVDSSGTSAILGDALGSTLGLVNSSGAIGTGYAYGPFGQTTTSGTTSINPFQYTGREMDSTGLYFLRARYYNPVLQRFISQDPVGLSGGQVNFYAYTFNNPINFMDRMGQRGGFGDLSTGQLIALGLDPFTSSAGFEFGLGAGGDGMFSQLSGMGAMTTEEMLDAFLGGAIGGVEVTNISPSSFNGGNLGTGGPIFNIGGEQPQRSSPNQACQAAAASHAKACLNGPLLVQGLATLPCAVAFLAGPEVGELCEGVITGLGVPATAGGAAACYAQYRQEVNSCAP